MQSCSPKDEASLPSQLYVKTSRPLALDILLRLAVKAWTWTGMGALMIIWRLIIEVIAALNRSYDAWRSQVFSEMRNVIMIVIFFIALVLCQNSSCISSIRIAGYDWKPRACLDWSSAVCCNTTSLYITFHSHFLDIDRYTKLETGCLHDQISTDYQAMVIITRYLILLQQHEFVYDCEFYTGIIFYRNRRS